VKQVLRRLSRAPLFTAVTLLTLAATIGATIAIFSVVESVLLKPLPYPQAEELLSISQSAPGMNTIDIGMGPSDYLVFREHMKAFQDIGLYLSDSASVTGTGEPERVRVLRVTDGTIPILGVPPVLGRWFSRQDDLPSDSKMVMITYGYWQRKFAGDSSVIGKTLQLDGKTAQVIGVLAQRFHFLAEEDPDLIVPLQLDVKKVTLAAFAFHGIARLKPGMTIADANADEARMLPIVLRSFPMPQGFSVSVFESAGFEPFIQPLKQDVVGDVSKSLWILMGAVGMVLLIACANVANLLLVRVEGRRQELAVRAALGASRSQIARDLLLESGILALLGSVLGLSLAYGLLRVLVRIAPNSLPRIREIGIDGPVLLFTFVVSLFASLLVGSIPIFKHADARPSTGLREGGRGQSQGREQHRARNVLVVVQVALALVLLICSGLMLRTYMALSHVQPGFSSPSTLQIFSLSIPKTEVADAEQVARLYQDILHRIAAVPGVSSAALSNTIPLDGTEVGTNDNPLYTEDHAYQSGQLPPLRNFRVASPGYLATMGTPLIAGRDFTWTDLYNKIPAVMISENLARELWQDPAAALGKRVRVGTAYQWQEIVGVVGDVYENGVDKPAPKSIYWPIMRNDLDGGGLRAQRTLAVAVRTPRAGSEILLKDLQQAVWAVDGNLPLANVRTSEYFYRKSMAHTSFTLTMLAAAGGMALLLGSVGIYGVIAYSVSQRTREIGIRMALGAQRTELTGMFLRHALLLTSIGIFGGLAVAAALSRVMASLVFPVSPVDPATYVAVVVGLFATALFASYLPSRRAATVDAIEALRSE
jgi:predicted permease